MTQATPNIPPKRVLLTGGAGYIGSHTAVVFVSAGHEVVLFDNFCNSQRDMVGRVSRIVGREVPMVEGDVRDTGLLRRVIEDQGIDAVIHFAGLKAVGESVVKPIDYYANNVQGTIGLVEAMQATGLKTLVFSSSATVYGVPQYLPIDESHPTAAISPYGRSKLHIEEMLFDLVRSDPAWRIACLRYFNPVGAHESGLIGEDPVGIPNNLMPYLARVATGQLDVLRVFGSDYPTQDGTGLRDYIHVMDLAEGHLRALDFLARESGWHIFNLGTGLGHTVLEMVRAFEVACGRPIPYRLAARRSGDVAACYARADLAASRLGWRARRGLDEMCASTWRWQSGRDSAAAPLHKEEK